MRERGVAATSFRDVLDRSGAPRGSIYHHFPGGKTQLIEEATDVAVARIERALTSRLGRTAVAGAVRAIAGVWRDDLEATGYVAGCPLVAAGLGTEPGARDKAGAAFGRLSEVIAGALVVDGVPEKRAASLGTLVVGALEGALVMAQAQRSPDPLDAVVEELETLLRGVT